MPLRTWNVRVHLKTGSVSLGQVAADLRGSPFDPFRMSYRLQIGIYGFKSRAELLRFYLDLNFGGTAHAPQEIERVKGLLAQAAGN